MALYAGALPVIAAALIGGSYESLRPPWASSSAVSRARAPELGLQAAGDEQIEALASSSSLPCRPAGCYWVAMFALNLYLAGRIAPASGRLGRDWPDCRRLAYPPGLPAARPRCAVAASFAAGAPSGVAGTSFTGAFLFAYLLAGLALMHFIARGRGALDPLARLCRPSSCSAPTWRWC